jgi:uncharacterized protein (DUF433 family)
MTIKTCYEHILIGKGGEATVAGTTMKVVELVAESLAYGWSPEELHLQHPYLTMGQIHSALAYYWDHEEVLNREIQQDVKDIEQIRKAAGPSPLVRRLKRQGLRL